MERRYVYRHFRFPKNVKDGKVICSAGGWLEPKQYKGRHGTAYHYQRGVSQWEPEERGGYTLCKIYERDACRTMAFAECSPRDNFNYRIGRAIARGRAEKALRA